MSALDAAKKRMADRGLEWIVALFDRVPALMQGAHEGTYGGGEARCL